MAGESPIPHPREWSVIRLGDIALKVGSGATPLGGEDSYLPARDRFALVRSQNVFDRRFDVDGLAFISDEQVEGLKNVILKEGDLLLNITGDGITFARCSPVPKEILPACVNQHVAIIRVDPRRADPGYVLSYLTHPAVKSYMESFNAGGSRRAITKGHIESFELALPPLKEQRAIAHILGTLDDKIELNRRMNETLEAMARAIFKSWFVDFLPVRAKMAAKENDPSLLLPQGEANTWFVYAIECNDSSLYIGQTEDLRHRWLQHVGGRGGNWTRQHSPVRVPYWERQPSREAAVEREKWLKTRYGRKWLKKEIAARTQTGDPVGAKAEGRDPGLPKEIADLFPDRFEDSELGEIPAGWEIRSLYDCAEYINGSAFGNEHFSLDRSGLPVIKIAELKNGVTEQTKFTEATLDSKYRIASGDILFSWSGSPDTSIDTFVWEGGDGWLNQHIFKISFKRPEEKYFVYYLLRHFKPEFVEIARNKQTTGLGHVTVQDLISLKTVFPLDVILRELNRTVEPLFQKTYINRCESRVLAALRDTLLPKLICGNLRVNIETEARAVVSRRGEARAQ